MQAQGLPRESREERELWVPCCLQTGRAADGSAPFQSEALPGGHRRPHGSVTEPECLRTHQRCARAFFGKRLTRTLITDAHEQGMGGGTAGGLAGGRRLLLRLCLESLPPGLTCEQDAWVMMGAGGGGWEFSRWVQKEGAGGAARGGHAKGALSPNTSSGYLVLLACGHEP